MCVRAAFHRAGALSGGPSVDLVSCAAVCGREHTFARYGMVKGRLSDMTRETLSMVVVVVVMCVERGGEKAEAVRGWQTTGMTAVVHMRAMEVGSGAVERGERVAKYIFVHVFGEGR